MIEVGSENILTAEEVELLDKANKRTFPCRWCDQPLEGDFVYFELEGNEFYAGVRLGCRCSFVEF